ncbi:MAG: O-acetylhomoserine aminocarboxypropyltransferase/cysteine synthase family protein [Clostridia bacterium]
MDKFNTLCVQAGYTPKNGEPRVLPLFQSTTYSYDTPEQLAQLFDLSADGHIYTRISNPTISCFEQKVAALEGGAAALACSSGLAAESLAVMNVCSAGDNIVSMSTIYGGSFNLFNVTLRKFGIDTKFIEPSATSAEIEALIDKNTKILYAETLANPAMTICDFDKLSAIAKKHQILFMVDNTLATPYIVKPIEYGANIVVHSSTKYLDGHASCVGGVIVDGANFNFKGNARFNEFNVPDESYHGLVYIDGATPFITKARVQMMRDLGNCISPFNAYLTNMGAETLHLRMQRHCDNALALAQELQNHPNVEWVKYAGLKGDENYDLAKKYFKNGCSGMVVFGVRGTREQANQFMKNLKLFKIVTHIADVRSCVLHPATTTHRQLSSQELIACGISETLIRLSVGIEDIEDIKKDIKQALDAIKY